MLFRGQGQQAFISGKGSLYIVAVIFAVAVQVQLTLFQSEDYLGLRINAADFLLPFAGIGILVSLLLKKSKWPDWRLPYMYLWLAALTTVLGLAFVNGYYLTGEFSQWAFVNKFIGWFVLMAYFGLGGWFSTNGGERSQRAFLKAFLWFFLVIFVIDIGRGLYDVLGPGLDGPFFQLSGIMGNRNAYAFLLLASMALLTVIQFDQPDLIRPVFFKLFWSLLFVAAILNGSRAGWAGGAVLMAFFFLRYKRAWLKQAGSWFIAGAVITVIVFQMMDGGALDRENQVDRLVEGKQHASEQVRFRGFADGLEFWQAHPVTGIGLGSFLTLSEEKYADQPETIIDVIHSTSLWLLVETGLIGVTILVLFFLALLWALWRDGKGNMSLNGRLLWSVLLMLLTFGLLSLVHELFYTRFLWLFMGLAMSRVLRKGTRYTKLEGTSKKQ